MKEDPVASNFLECKVGWRKVITSVLGTWLCLQTLWAVESTNAPATAVTAPSYAELLAASQVAVRDGNMPRAMAWVATALKRDPLRPEAYVLAAQLLGASGHTKGAREMSRRALDLAAPRQKSLVERSVARWIAKDLNPGAADSSQRATSSTDTDWLVPITKTPRK